MYLYLALFTKVFQMNSTHVRTISLAILLGFFIQVSTAQDFWDFETPKINTNDFPIQDTIYMSVDGNDDNSGTIDDPVATFDKAMDLLPFGTVGINNGHAYGLIRLLPGEYIVEGGFNQYAIDYEQNNTFKNISIEGIGDVVIRGTKDQFAVGHMIKLLGSHIFVKNIEVKYGTIHGLFLGSDNQQTDVLIDNVTTDSVMSFGMLFHNIRNIEVKNSKVLHSSRPGHENDITPCQWPSGLKFYNCEYAVCHGTEIAHTRGEGLNFHNSSYGLAYNNILHDNPTNIYCDNSQKIIIRKNFNYSTPGNYKSWLTCPGDTVLRLGSTGILIANEGACDGGLGPTYNGCTTICPLGDNFPHTDSIFISNNLFVNAAPALSLWQGVTEPLGGPNCLKNIYFEHNTVVGVTGGYDTSRPAFINAFFPNFHNTLLGFGYATVSNLQINNNIFAMPKDVYPLARLANITLHNTFPVPFQLIFNNNLVNIDNNIMDSDNFITEFETTSIEVDIDSVMKYFQPCDNENPELIYNSTGVSWIQDDYFSTQRNSENNNIGAIVRSELCTNSLTLPNVSNDDLFTLFPNPTNHSFRIENVEIDSDDFEVTIYDQLGNQKFRKSYSFEPTIDISNLPNGIYLVTIRSHTNIQTRKLLKVQ